MVSISLVKRKYKLADGGEAWTEHLYAQIRFSEPSAAFLRSTGTADRRKAKQIAQRLAREIEENELPQIGKPKHTIEGMFSQWTLEHGKDLRSGKDINWQLGLILEILGGTTPIARITNKTIHGFVQGAKERGKSPVVINRCLTTLRAIMNYAAVNWEAQLSMIAWGKMKQKEPKVREIWISPEEARKLMEKLPEHIALAMAFSIYTGMRLNELETLTWERIDFERGLATVETKGGGTRGVWLSKKALGMLPILTPSPVPVFSLKNRRKHWESARKMIGRPELHWHDLRACCASWCRRYAGKDLRLIGHALGHSGTKVTERYARVENSEVVAMLDALPDIMAIEG